MSDGKRFRFEEYLAEYGELTYTNRGVSMLPMLRERRDLLTIRAKGAEPLKKYDVALYRRGKDYVLHRVIGLGKDHYLIRGDNTYAVERVPFDAVIGVLTGFQRDGRQYAVTDRRYQCYVRVWCALYPLRAFGVRCRRLAARLARKIDLYPRLKKGARRG